MSQVRYFLKRIAGGEEIEVKGELSVGRSAENALKVTEGNPSRRHALFTMSGDALFLEDLKSVNGTFVNGTRISSKMRLAPNDKIRFDLEEYVLRVEAPAPVDDKTALRVLDSGAAAPAVKPNLPPAWADGGIGAAAGNKTVFKSIQEMEEERKRAHKRAEGEQLGPVTVPSLTIYEGGGLPLTVQLRADPSKSEWSVGSDEGREIRIALDGVSGLHAKIVNSGKQWKVVDQVSGNGTFVNGKRVTVCQLNGGDRIAFGPVECVFQAPGSKAPAAVASSSAAVVDARRKRGLLIAAFSFLGTLILVVVLMKWLR